MDNNTINEELNRLKQEATQKESDARAAKEAAKAARRQARIDKRNAKKEQRMLKRAEKHNKKAQRHTEEVTNTVNAINGNQTSSYRSGLFIDGKSVVAGILIAAAVAGTGYGIYALVNHANTDTRDNSNDDEKGSISDTDTDDNIDTLTPEINNEEYEKLVTNLKSDCDYLSDVDATLEECRSFITVLNIQTLINSETDFSFENSYLVIDEADRVRDDIFTTSAIAYMNTGSVDAIFKFSPYVMDANEQKMVVKAENYLARLDVAVRANDSALANEICAEFFKDIESGEMSHLHNGTGYLICRYYVPMVSEIMMNRMGLSQENRDAANCIIGGDLAEANGLADVYYGNLYAIFESYSDNDDCHKTNNNSNKRSYTRRRVRGFYDASSNIFYDFRG